MANGLKDRPIKKDADEELLERLVTQFKHAYNAEKSWRKEKQEDERFYDGDQLSDDEKKALKDRNQPEVVFNRIKPRIDTIIGIQRGSQVKSKAFPRGLNDPTKARAVSEAFRYIEYNTNFELVESIGFRSSMIGGRGWYKHERVFEGLELEFKAIAADPNDVFLDPFCKKDDLTDAKHISETVWMDLEDAESLWPDHKEELENSLHESETIGKKKLREFNPDQYREPGDTVEQDSDVFYDRKRKRVRVISQWWRTPFKRTFAYVPGGDPIETTDLSSSQMKQIRKENPNLVEFDELHYKVNNATFTRHIILEKKMDIRKDGKFPWVLVPCYVKHNESREPYGMVRQYKDAQKELNKRRSKMLHLLNVNQVIMERGAVSDKNRLRKEVARPDGVIEIENPDLRFEIQKNTDVAASQFQLLQESKAEIDFLGVQNEVVGQQSNATSGKAIQLRQQASSNILKPLFDNLRQARKRIAELWLADMQEYWTNQKLIRITDDQGALKEIILNERVVNPETGELEIRNDITNGKFDIIVEEAPDTLNLQSEQLQGLISLASSGLPFPPPVALSLMEMYIEASTLPNKEKLVQSFQQMKAQVEAQQQQEAELRALQAMGQQPSQAGAAV